MAVSGRELYSAPFIWISSKDYDGKTTFSVAHVEIKNKKIIKLSIVNEKTGEIVFEWSKADYNKPIGREKLEVIKQLNLDPLVAKEVLEAFGYEKSTDIKVKDFPVIFKRLKGLSE